MGKILNTTYKDSVEDISHLYTEVLNNPFYNLNDKRPITVTYYNINKDHTSLDPGSKLAYDNIGYNTPLRWNRIYNFILYGISRIELQNQINEFGTEADPIEGEAYIMPNTIIPYENDYFEINHVKDSTWLFIVKDVQQDTLDNGTNVYKISYKLEYMDHSQILNNIVYNFEAIEKREGTNILTVVRREDLDIARKIDEYAVKLKKYFTELFYSDKVQTFIYQDLTEVRVYDPFMIEFLIRNEILENGEEGSIFVMHQINPPVTFNLTYDKTMFRAFEKQDTQAIKYVHQTNITDIKAYGTTFSARFEPYFQATWKEKDFRGHETMCLGEDILYAIQDHKIFRDDDQLNVPSILWKNILVKHFYNESFDEDELKAIDDIRFDEAAPIFYLIPLLIYCLEFEIERILN